MGSLKDEMRGLREDHQPCEKTDEGGRPGGSDSSAAPEGAQLNTNQETATQEDYQPKLHVNASSVEETDKDQTSKDPALSGGDCDNTDQSDSEQVKDSTQTDDMPLIHQPEADKTATHADTTISIKLLNDGDGEIQKESGEDKTLNHDGEKDPDIETISVAVPSTPDPTDPCTPAPFGQHHMRTQVSLEVVQCHSAATSPMTPPEGGHSFFFPSSFGKSGSVGSDTKDAELQVGQQVEFCSVATSPMTPKTPSTTAFPELIGRETAQKEKVKKSEEQRESSQQDSFPATKSPAVTESEISGVSKFTTSKELSEGFSSNASPETSNNCLAVGLIDSRATLEDSNQHCKQQRMGSMDQDITILVTHYGNNEEEDEDKAESSFCSIEPEMVKIDEYEEAGENGSDVQGEDGKERIPAETDHAQDTSTTNHSANQAEEPKTLAESETPQVKEKNNACEELRDVSVTKPPVPESPAPFGCHNIRTQVSLEVVQCQSVATSPMTPPEGDQAFCFPSSFGKCATMGTDTKDAELQVGQQVEFRSVATAPMTPRTPVATTFPEVRKETNIEEKILEEEEDAEEQAEEDAKEKAEEDAKENAEDDAKEQVKEDAKEKAEEDAKEQVKEDAKEQEEEDAKEQVEEDTEEEKGTEEEKVEATEENKQEAINFKEKGEEKCEEPVQEVSWDEKGMTWEVYGAVVEVAVLGSAIQKHLEKQVKKQKRQSTLPPPPPLNPSATPLESAHGGGSGSGKGRAGKRGEQDGKVSRRRRNPFRQLMENMQQPHCCSRAHTTE